MKIKWLWVPLLCFGLFSSPALADNRVIVRTTLGFQGIQQVCHPILFIRPCTVVRGLGDPLNQLFLVTTPLDLTTFLNLLGNIAGIVDVEADQVVRLVGGLNQLGAPPAGLFDTAPNHYFNTNVWNGYAVQPAAQIVRVSDAQSIFHVSGLGIVADIDTGVDQNHPALKQVLLQGYDFTRNQPGGSEMSDFSGPPPNTNTSNIAQVNQSTAAVLDQSTAAVLDGNPQYSAFGHGTMVLGVVHLTAPRANLLPLKAFDSSGSGFLSDILRAIYFSVQNGANVVNMSFDFKTNSTEFNNALDYANQNGLICVSSAGNDGMQEIVYPAALQSHVMGVASTSDADTRSTFSNYGNAIVWVAAPGEAIISTYPFGTYAASSGTSFSAPFVSGGSALLLDMNKNIDQNGAASAIANAVPVGAGMGNGRLDLLLALQFMSKHPNN